LKKHRKKYLCHFTFSIILLLIIAFFSENTSANIISYENEEDFTIRDAIVFPIDFHSSNYARLAITEASLTHYLNKTMKEDEVIEKALTIYESLKIGNFELIEFPAISSTLGEHVPYQILNQVVYPN
jgi:hypothetical protein